MSHLHIFNMPREWEWNQFNPDYVIKRFKCKKCEFGFSAIIRIDDLDEYEKKEIKEMCEKEEK